MEEYDFSNENEVEEEEDNEHDIAYYRDPKGVMVISDDEDDGDRKEEREIAEPDARPWKKFEPEHRRQYEHMFWVGIQTPHHKKVEATEEYWRALDEQMRLYVHGIFSLLGPLLIESL